MVLLSDQDHRWCAIPKKSENRQQSGELKSFSSVFNYPSGEIFSLSSRMKKTWRGVFWWMRLLKKTLLHAQAIRSVRDGTAATHITMK